MGAGTAAAVHAICEWLLAGPQHATSGTIRLRVGDHGLATTAQPDVELGEAGLRVGNRTVPVLGTVADVAEAAGLPLGRPDVHYRDPVPAGPGSDLDFDPVDFRQIHQWYLLGRDALLDFQPGEIPVLWPEHMDVAIRYLGVNYGVAPPDSAVPVPYAYVGPDQMGDDPFWNAPFGAAVPVGDFIAADPSRSAAAIADFFREGLDRATD